MDSIYESTSLTQTHSQGPNQRNRNDATQKLETKDQLIKAGDAFNPSDILDFVDLQSLRNYVYVSYGISC